jgi:hypothetical protein
MPTQYKLTGVAFVPVQVEMIISASSKKAARNKAIKAFHGNPAAYVVPNSEEEASAFDFEPTECETMR